MLHISSGEAFLSWSHRLHLFGGWSTIATGVVTNNLCRVLVEQVKFPRRQAVHVHAVLVLHDFDLPAADAQPEPYSGAGDQAESRPEYGVNGERR